MIKFKMKLGFKHLNMEARLHKQLIQPNLKGMRCIKCPGVDTLITFKEKLFHGSNPLIQIRILLPVIESACCPEFEQRILIKLKGKRIN